MTKSPRKNVPDMGHIELGAACTPSGHASNRATALGDDVYKETKVQINYFFSSFLSSAYG